MRNDMPFFQQFHSKVKVELLSELVINSNKWQMTPFLSRIRDYKNANRFEK